MAQCLVMSRLAYHGNEPHRGTMYILSLARILVRTNYVFTEAQCLVMSLFANHTAGLASPAADRRSLAVYISCLLTQIPVAISVWSILVFGVSSLMHFNSQQEAYYI